MIAVLLFTLAIVSLPVLGEIWKRGDDNIVTQMRTEVRDTVKPYTAAAITAYEDLRESAGWAAILTLLIAVIRMIVKIASDLLDDFREK